MEIEFKGPPPVFVSICATQGWFSLREAGALTPEIEAALMAEVTAQVLSSGEKPEDFDFVIGDVPVEVSVRVIAKKERSRDMTVAKSLEPHIGDYQRTFSGVMFYPWDPRPEDVTIEDIAHHLSLVTRFAGATVLPYSVAQHSLLVEEYLRADCDVTDPEVLLQALMHDSTEAYLNDLTKQVKVHCEDYKRCERSIWHVAICPRFGMATELHELIHHADKVLLVTEQRDLYSEQAARARAADGEQPCATPWTQKVVPMSAWDAEQRFRQRFDQLEVARCRG